MSGKISLTESKEVTDAKIGARYAGLKGDYIGQHVWRTMKVKSASGAGVAVLPVIGTLTKRGDACSYGMRDYMNELDALNERDDVTAIVLDTEGPGGTVDGTPEFGLAIKNSKKPVVAFVDCMAASADYWIASQAKHIISNANNPTEVGSIGVLCVHEYWGKFIEENIGTIEIIRAPQSKDKALVNPIEALSDDQRKLIVADLKELANNFFAAVKSGRGDALKESEKVWGTGKMYKNSEALAIGLIDAEGTLMDAVNKAAELAGRTNENAGAQGAQSQITNKESMTKNKASKPSSFFGKAKAVVKAAASVVHKEMQAQAAAEEAAEDDTTPMWTADMVFNTDGSGDGAFCKHTDSEGNDRKFETKIDNNQGNEPPTDPAVTENDSWSVVAEEEAATEETQTEEQPAATTVTKLNAALKASQAEVKALKAEVATFKQEKATNEKKPAAGATSVIPKGDEEKGQRELTPAEQEAAQYVKASSTNLFKD